MKLLVLLASVVFTSTTFASQITFTCGESSYEALDQKNIELAEFSLVLNLKGPNNPAELVTIRDNYDDISSGVSSVTYAKDQVSVQMKNYDKYEITNITGCDDLDTATADIAFSKYVGGFAGHAGPVKAKCSCQK